jgi:hypothetical protein
MTVAAMGTFAQRRSPAQDVLLVRYGFEMGGVHTTAISTEMIENKPGRNWPNEILVCETLCALCGPALVEEHRISVAIDGR